MPNVFGFNIMLLFQYNMATKHIFKRLRDKNNGYNLFNKNINLTCLMMGETTCSCFNQMLSKLFHNYL